MPVEIVFQPTPALVNGREQLTAIRSALAERESELGPIRARLRTFDLGRGGHMALGWN